MTTSPLAASSSVRNLGALYSVVVGVALAFAMEGVIDPMAAGSPFQWRMFPWPAPRFGTTCYVRPAAIGGPRSCGTWKHQVDGLIASGAGGRPPSALWGRNVLYSRLHCSTSTAASLSV